MIYKVIICYIDSGTYLQPQVAVELQSVFHQLQMHFQVFQLDFFPSSFQSLSNRALRCKKKRY